MIKNKLILNSFVTKRFDVLQSLLYKVSNFPRNSTFTTLLLGGQYKICTHSTLTSRCHPRRLINSSAFPQNCPSDRESDTKIMNASNANFSYNILNSSHYLKPLSLAGSVPFSLFFHFLLLLDFLVEPLSALEASLVIGPETPLSGGRSLASPLFLLCNKHLL